MFHLAAEPGVRPSWGRFERYVRNNVLATQLLLEATRKRPDRRFVYASSSSVYGEAERLPTVEDAAAAPYSPLRHDEAQRGASLRALPRQLRG